MLRITNHTDNLRQLELNVSFLKPRGGMTPMKKWHSRIIQKDQNNIQGWKKPSYPFKKTQPTWVFFGFFGF